MQQMKVMEILLHLQDYQLPVAVAVAEAVVVAEAASRQDFLLSKNDQDKLLIATS
ncbi:MAG: hypothetical protein KAI43_03230 [Candidatus Aureabacteria bacterium]|nr:hypothetical protein [Candidatus Auribacterota bacterium]